MSDLQPFDFDGERFPVVQMPNGEPGIPLRRLAAPVGLNARAQQKRIERSPWSQGRASMMDAQLPGDTQTREHFVISHRIIPMWIATIDAPRIDDPAARDRIIRWQCEMADALYDYVFLGGAINPRATEDQLAAVISRAQGQATVLQSLRGVVHSGWLEAHGRIVAARALGIEPDLDPATRPLTVDEYLEEHGVPAGIRSRIRSGFGRHLAAAYRARHGTAPMKTDRNIGGRITQVNGYTENDRPLFDQVWTAFELGQTA